ncbi:hypothetical protein CA233_22185 [Sphingomonas sp. ABOLD]|nr:hypothetical protein CA233_22185 [Sphingomonas sp. ABOLD]
MPSGGVHPIRFQRQGRAGGVPPAMPHAREPPARWGWARRPRIRGPRRSQESLAHHACERRASSPERVERRGHHQAAVRLRSFAGRVFLRLSLGFNLSRRDLRPSGACRNSFARRPRCIALPHRCLLALRPAMLRARRKPHCRARRRFRRRLSSPGRCAFQRRARGASW